MNVSRVLSASTDTVIPLLRSFVPVIGRRHEASGIVDVGSVRTVGYYACPQDGKLIAAWDDLVARVPTATVFQTPQWQRAVLAWPERLNRLLLIAVWQGERLIAIFPLQKKRGHRLESAGAIVSDYLEPLIDPSECETAWRAIFSFIREKRGEDRQLTLHNIRPDTICREGIKRFAREEGFGFEEHVCGSSSFLQLPPTWDDYLASLKGGDRKELKRKLAKAESQGQAVLECDQSATQTQTAAERVLSFIEAGGGERGMKCRWLFRGLLGTTGQTLAERRWLRVFSLNLQQRQSAGVIAFRSAGGWMTWATGYEATKKSFSPGIVTFAMTIRRAIEEGAQHLDLLRGHSDYKARLGGVERPLYQMVLLRK